MRELTRLCFSVAILYFIHVKMQLFYVKLQLCMQYEI